MDATEKAPTTTQTLHLHSLEGKQNVDRSHRCDKSPVTVKVLIPSTRCLSLMP